MIKDKKKLRTNKIVKTKNKNKKSIKKNKKLITKKIRRKKRKRKNILKGGLTYNNLIKKTPLKHINKTYNNLK